MAGLFAGALFAFSEPAFAAGDAAIAAATSKVLSTDFAGANYGVARTKLRGLLDQCKRTKCQPQTSAQVHVALGMVAAQIGQVDEAKQLFTDAIKEDFGVQLPSAGVTPAIKTAFDEAKKAVPPPSATPDPKAKGGSVNIPPGWTSREAYELFLLAHTAHDSQLWEQCIEKAQASLKSEDQLQTRLILASCEQGAGKLIDALRNAQRVLQGALQRRDMTSVGQAKTRVEDLLKKIPHVTFVPPAGVSDLVVYFNKKEVPTGSGNKQFSVDPGRYPIHAEGHIAQVPVSFDETYDVKEGDNLTIQIALKPTRNTQTGILTEGQRKCMDEAKTQEDVVKCLPEDKKPISIRVGADIGGYMDTTAVRVLTPGIHGGVSSPTQGWNVGGSYLVDVVTAASPDLVSTASRRFHDTRHAGSLNGGYKPGRYGFDASASLSVENDYISRNIHGSVLGDFMDKRVTPRLGVGYSKDTIGRAGTSYDVFSNDFSVLQIDGGATIVLSPTAILVVGGTAQIERGDQSKPYRLIPMFDGQTSVPVGASVESVNANRLPIRPYEQLPLQRDRYALAARFAKRIGTATLRLEERLYRDSWQTYASTTDFRYIMDSGKRLSFWPHLRLHGQTGSNFYQRAYVAEISPVVRVPAFRTTDRELSPSISLTAGGGARYDISSETSKNKYALVLAVDSMFSRYFDALYIKNRLAVYGTFGIEAEFE